MADNVAEILIRAKMEATDVTSELNNIQKQLKGLTIPKDIAGNLEKSFEKLGPLLKDYQKQLDKGLSTTKDLKNFEALRSKISETIGGINSELKKVDGKEIRVKADLEGLKKLQEELAKSETILDNAFSKLYKSGNTAQGTKNFIKSLQTTFETTVTGNNKVGFTNLTNMTKDLSKFFRTQDFVAFNNQIEKIRNNISNLGSKSKINLAHQLGLKETIQDADKAEKYINNLLNNIKVNQGAANTITQTKEHINELKNSMEQIDTKKAENGINALGNAGSRLNNVSTQFDKISQSAMDAGNSVVKTAEQINQLKSSTQYFFGLRNMFNMLKRGLHQAFETVKELDKAMTETAVVTKYDVSDMWNMLPRYTKIANELGATTKGAYETMTLYFQQGLGQQSAFEIGTETMKMARIAGLDYVKATDMMTAALRGFNMELNATSAQRVNDVYSELAARTASNTQEIGEAMQRTASIAASAGMSFEGTSAFLAQMIETTREAPENLGTAMKTIVARFQELKKSPLEIGEVDGEEVSYNKIDKALQEIGVSLKKDNGEFRDLDQVFLDIAEKWDGLTQVQQRYIATTAAGSRQQSRFIAMMSDYERTQELMSYATNSSGASQKQFEKTLESLEAKLNKFQNAWKEFLMGLASNGMIKGFLDKITSALSFINNLIDTLSGGIGPVKSALTIFTAFQGLKFAGRGINAVLGGLGASLSGKSFMYGVRGGAINGRNESQAKAIYQPIVSVLHQILGRMKGGNAEKQQQERSGWSEYKQANNNYRNIASKKGSSVQDLFGSLEKLDATQIRSIAISNPGIQRQLQKSLGETFNKTIADAIIGSMKAGVIGGKDLAQLNKTNVSKLINIPEAQQYTQDYYKSVRDEVTNQLFEDFINKSSLDAEGKKALREKGFKEAIKGDSYESKALKNYIKQKYTQRYKSKIDEDSQQPINLKEQSKIEKFEQALGRVGSATTTAGQGLLSFGNILRNLGFEQAAAGAESLGYTFISLGQTISGVITLMSTALANPIILAATAVIGIIGYTIHSITKEIKDIKQAAQDVTDSYNTAKQSAEKNIASLKAWKGELATLSQGVDENGLNVSLSDEDYARYLEIVDAIAEMNPEIVKGYNAQGHAIIDNNEALSETLQLQEKINKEARDQYLNESSLRKLINARNAKGSKYNKYIDQQIYNEEGKQLNPFSILLRRNAKHLNYNEIDTGLTTDKAPFRQEIKKISQQLDEDNTWFNEEVKKGLEKSFGINYDKLKQGDRAEVLKFNQNSDKIYNYLQNQATSKGGHLSDGLINAFDKYSTAAEEFNEELQPIYDWLRTSVSQSPFFESLDSEFQSVLLNNLDSIAWEFDTPEDMMKAAENMAHKFDAYAKSNGAYQTALKGAEEAQDKYADTLDKAQYQADIKKHIESLKQLKVEAENMGTAYGDALAQYINNKIEQIENFTERGSQSLTQALNTMTDRITAAQNAYDTFHKNVENKTFTSAALSMSKIVEEGLEDVHTGGKGDQAFWGAAEETLGRNNIRGKSKSEVEAMMKSTKEMLTGNEQGWHNFLKDIRKNYKENGEALKKAGIIYNPDKDTVDFEIKTDEQFTEAARILGKSENTLAAILNTGRQYGNVSFSDDKAVRKLLSISDIATQGVTEEKGKRVILVNEEAFRDELSQGGITNIQEQDEEIKKYAQKENIKTIAKLSNVEEKDRKAMIDILRTQGGVKNQKGLIELLGGIGFGLEDIQEYAEELQKTAEETGYQGNLATLSKDYTDWLNKTKDPVAAKQLDTLQSIESDVAYLARRTETEGLKNGEYDKERSQAGYYEDLIFGDKDDNADTMFELFRQGKDINGNKLNKEDYERSFQDILDIREAILERINLLKEAQAKNPAKAEEIQQEIDSLTGTVEYVNGIIEEGTKNGQNPYFVPGSTPYEQAHYNREGELDNNGLINTENTEVNSGSVTITDENKDTITGTDTDSFDSISNSGPIKWLKGEEGPGLEFFGKINSFLPDFFTTLAKGPTTVFDNLLNTLFPTITSNIKDNTYQPQTSDTFEKTLGIDFSQISTTLTESSTALTNAGTELTTAAGNLTNAAAILATLTPNSLGEQPVPHQGNPTTPPTIPSQGISSESSISGVIVVDNEPAIQALADVTSAANEAREAIQTEAVFSISVNDTGLKDAGANAKKIADAAGSSQIINVAASKVDTKTVDEAVSNIGQTIAKLPVKTKDETNEGLRKIKNDIANTTATLTVKAKPSGTTNFTVTVHGGTSDNGTSGAKGINNKFSVVPLPAFGSLAKGTKSHYGQVGPRNRGGLTLTGEKGFEIAWLPSENRSMILGTQGPQMLNLPKDAVVYTHEQSKKIIKQQGIPAGSHVIEGKGNKVGGDDEGIIYKKGKNKKKEKNKKKTKKKNTDKGSNTVNFSIEEVIRFNLDQRLSKIASDIKKSSKQIEKNLEKIGIRASDISASVKKQVKSLQTARNYNQQLLKSYQKQSAEIPGYKTKISYSKGGKKKKNKEETIKFGDYIKKNKDGFWEVDTSKITGSKDRQEAIYKAVNSVIKEMNSGIIKAKEAIDDYNAQIEELQQKVYEAFYGWENELTRIYNLTQKIENISSRRDRFSEQINLELVKLSAGFGDTATAIKNISEVISRDNQSLAESVVAQQDMIAARKAELENLFSYADEANEVATLIKQGASQARIDAAKDSLKVAQDMRKYMSNITWTEDGSISYNINYEQFEKDRRAGNINETTYNAIKDALDKLNEGAVEYNNSIKDLTSLMSETYTQIREYQDFQADLESDLLSGLEQQIQQDIDNAKNISSSITDALKDLLDQVKRKLDERRKQEDNQKTENDIAKKQQRLAMLRADTSGGHQVEIVQLQQEIAESQQTYQRSLEDQMLENLQNNADEAAKQREHQIEILEAIQTIGIDNRELVKEWVEHPEKYQQEITNVLKNKNNFDNLGFLEQRNMIDDIDKRIAQSQQAQNKIEFFTAEQLKAIFGKGEEEVTKDNTEAGGESNNKIDKNGQMTTEKTALGAIKAAEATKKKKTSSSSGTTSAAKTPTAYLKGLPAEALKKVNDIKNLQRGLNQLLKDGKLNGFNRLTVDGDYGKKTKAAVKILQKALGVVQDGKWGPKTRAAAIKKFPGYASGGLANFTGPAWLDGTPSKPELVLSAADTKNFIALKDILSKAISSSDTLGSSYGDATYEININVDHINSDYDVDRVAERVKKIIVKDSGYRNVTQVRRLR